MHWLGVWEKILMKYTGTEDEFIETKTEFT
jgi:hypothetical protein